MDLLDANSASRAAGEEGEGLMRSFARDARRCGAGRAGKGGMGTCPKCGTDDKVEVFEMPTVPKGQVVIKVEGEEGEEEGEEGKAHHEAQGQQARHRRSMEAVPRLRLQGEGERHPRQAHQEPSRRGEGS